MHPYKRKRRTRRDMVVLGGWLFADLLLGLAMLFAVANTVGQAPPTPTPTATPNQLETAEANLEVQQAENQETVEALEDQIAQAGESAQQTQEAADRQFAAATEFAQDEATRAALSESDRATADARATQDAISSEATIAALATEQAGSDSSVSDLNNQLATNVAQATEVAEQISAQSTQQAALQAQATENASSGANAQATAAAAQNQAATSQARANAAQATSEAQIGSAQATSEAASASLANVVATSEALQQQVELNSLNPVAVVQIVQVDLNGVLGGDAGAIEDARQALGTALTPYIEGQNCRIGFVLISSRAADLGDGVDLSEAIGEIIQEDFPQLLPEPADGSEPQLLSEAIAFPGTDPVGEVQLQMFLSVGCQPAGG